MNASPPSAARLFLKRLSAGGKRPFLQFPEGTVSYARMEQHVEHFCALFERERLDRGARVIITTRDETAAIAAFLAGFLDGKAPVLLSPETPKPRAESIAARTQAQLVVQDAGSGPLGQVERYLQIAPKPRSFLGSAAPDASLAEALKGLSLRRPEPPENQDTLAYLMFTSGTTSRSKGVCISHRNLSANLATLSHLFGYGGESRIFNGMVLSHGDGLVQGPLLALHNGCLLIRPPAFTPGEMENWLNLVRRHRTTHFISVPTIYALIEQYAQHNDYFDAEECRALLSVADNLDKSLWMRLEQRFGRPVFNQYGLTETVASALYAGPHPEMGETGTIGQPVDVAARLAPLNDGEKQDEGELQLKGGNVFSGYWADPDASAAAFTDDGWFKTGDLARALPDGAYQYLGRLKNVIMSGGFLIRPEEIDEALTRHPAVQEAVTLSLKESDFGEIAVSAVVLDPAAVSGVDEAALTDHCRRWLEPLKLPKRIVTVGEIPRGDAGKPRLTALREQLAEQLSRPAGPGDDTEETVLSIAASVFRLPRADLAPSMKAKEVKGWDSFTHLNLILRVEQSLSLRLPTSDVASIRSLRDLIEAVERAQ